MRKKLLRMVENAKATNVIEEGKEVYGKMKGGWHSYFGNDHPISLELGCGRGNYTVALAQRYPQQNFIGLDIKGARLWAGSKDAQRLALKNVAFLRTDIAFITHFFDKEEVREVYITFPDPYPRQRDAKRRLTSPRFLSLYKSILKAQGQLHLKTDSTDLFAYTVECLKKNCFEIEEIVEDIYHHLPEESIHRKIQTAYEERFLKEGLPIHYLRAKVS